MKEMACKAWRRCTIRFGAGVCKELLAPMPLSAPLDSVCPLSMVLKG
jgi:hypothetical protein